MVRRLLPRMPPQSLAMVLHGYAALGFPPHELLDGAAEHMAAGLASYPPQSVGTMVWAFAKLGVHPGRGLPGGGIATEVRGVGVRVCGLLFVCGLVLNFSCGRQGGGGKE